MILGQRIPKITLVERDSSLPLENRTKVPCPHCGELHPQAKWATQDLCNKNWFGLYCDACGNLIPCHTNLTHFVLRTLTAPLWIGFVSKWKREWLAKQPARYASLALEDTSLHNRSIDWTAKGLSWGFFMFLSMNILFPVIQGKNLHGMALFAGFLIWSLVGLGFGHALKHFSNPIHQSK